MCGINIIIDKRGKLTEDPIRLMTAATAHRGPDATAFETAPYGENGRIFFGHNRLKIIDPNDRSNQPFTSPDNRYLLLYNGELYNYRELRQRLQLKNISFRTESDTEVVLHLLIKEGQRALTHLNGMYALAFYDRQEQLLWLARDRFGIKPLYFAETPDYFLVSSEIKAIIASGIIPKELNPDQLKQYLHYRHAVKPQTFYKRVQELKEGCALYYSQGKSTLHTYTTPQHPTGPEKADQLITHTERLITDSLQKHLVADAPVGLFLSGGIDSTLLLALLHRSGHQQFPAFTIALKAAEKSFGSEDARFARMAAKKYNANHTVFEVDDSILSQIDALVSGLDQPIADGAALLTAYLAQQVKPHVKVALSGAGADELFGGYNRHRAFYKYLQNHRKALIFKHLTQPVAQFLPTGFNHPLRKKFLLWHKLSYKIQANPRQTFLNFTSLDNRLAALLLEPKIAKATPKPVSENADWLRWCLRHDQHHYLISDVLAVTDQASMQHSLEVRTPFLDNHLQLYLAGLPAEMLFQNGQKWVLKELLSRQGGEAFLNRPKEGFGLPLGRWLRQPHNQWLLTELQDPHHLLFSYLDFAGTQKLLQIHLRGRHDFSPELWALILLAKWLGHNFG